MKEKTNVLAQLAISKLFQMNHIEQLKKLIEYQQFVMTKITLKSKMTNMLQSYTE